jgi:hypothetical protein
MEDGRLDSKRLIQDGSFGVQGSEAVHNNPLHGKERANSEYASAAGDGSFADPNFDTMQARWLAESLNEAQSPRPPSDGTEYDSPWTIAMWAGMAVALITLCSVSASKGCGRECVWDNSTLLCALNPASDSGPCSTLLDEAACKESEADPLLEEPSQVG